MKKLFLVMGMMLSVTLFSCNNSEDLLEPVEQEVKDDSGKDDNKAWEDLRASVEYLNLRTFGTCYPGTTRSKLKDNLKKFWEKVKEVVRADAEAALSTISSTGSLDNAVVGGIMGSVVNIIHKESNDSVAPSRLAACSNYTLTNSSLSEAIPIQRVYPILLDSIGYLHNKVVIEKYNDNPAYFYAQNNCNDSLLYNICAIYAAEKGLSLSSLYSSLYNTDIINAIINENNGSALHYLCYLSGVNSEHLTFIDDYIDDLGEIQISQLNTYTTSLINTIENSNVSTSIKNTLIAGVVTAYASLHLWLEYYHMVGEI